MTYRVPKPIDEKIAGKIVRKLKEREVRVEAIRLMVENIRLQIKILALRDWIKGDRGVENPNLTLFYRRHGIARR